MELPTAPGIAREEERERSDEALTTPTPTLTPRGAYRHYLEQLPLTRETRCAIATPIDYGGNLMPHEAMTQLHRGLYRFFSDDATESADPAFVSSQVRLRLAYPGLAGTKRRNNAYALPLTPPVHRTSMVARPWQELNPLRRWLRAGTAPAQVVEDRSSPSWQTGGNIRRTVLLCLMAIQTGLATWFMSQVLPYHGNTPMEAGVLALFAMLFCWVSAGFWTAMTGLLVLLRGTDRFIISQAGKKHVPIDAAARTAVVMPICNEDVARVFAGLRATYESVGRTGELDRFDFFILSDSNDPDTCVAEVSAWAALCSTVNGVGRIFYRRRHRRVKRKSGNIDDFCRRWGNNYRYMVVLDADSVMSGTCLTTLVRMMEANPKAGIIQTAPRAAGRDTLYARIQQFSSRVYGPLFTAGLHYWQLGESHYWGHNAIIRVAPFMQHCALSPLPGRGALAGEILSHDFVEAALMRRAGWGVWIAFDLDGSYEEMPPNLLDELKRDRRWSHGNLMNARLFAASGVHPVHRAVFVIGVMAYLSAPLWLAFLALSTALLAVHTLTEPQYFITPRQLFPIWPQWHPDKAIGLFATTAVILFLPKLLAIFSILAQGAQKFGGALRLMASMLLELIFSSLLAPVRMLFHTLFVTAALLGWEVRWTSPPRDDSQTTWREALHKHGMHSLLGIAWGMGVYWLRPSYLPWLLPIAGALTLSVPLSVWSSKVSLGRVARSLALFTIPEESDPPEVLKDTYAYAAAAAPPNNFIDAVVDPRVNALMCAAAGHRRAVRQPQMRLELVQTALRSGPYALTTRQKGLLLADPLALSALHLEVWSSAHAHCTWRG